MSERHPTYAPPTPRCSPQTMPLTAAPRRRAASRLLANAGAREGLSIEDGFTLQHAHVSGGGVNAGPPALLKERYLPNSTSVLVNWRCVPSRCLAGRRLPLVSVLQTSSDRTIVASFPAAPPACDRAALGRLPSLPLATAHSSDTLPPAARVLCTRLRALIRAPVSQCGPTQHSGYTALHYIQYHVLWPHSDKSDDPGSRPWRLALSGSRPL